MTSYSVKYQTKRGGSGVLMTPKYEVVLKELRKCFREKRPATVFKNGVKIGECFEDNSCWTGWNYTIEYPSSLHSN